MVQLLKVSNLNSSVTTGDIRHILRSLQSRVDDIHLVVDKDGRKTGIAFLVYRSTPDAERGLEIQKRKINGRKVEVYMSSIREFNHYLPGVSMTSRKRVLGHGASTVQSSSTRAINPSNKPDLREKINRGRVESTSHSREYGKRRRSRSPISGRKSDSFMKNIKTSEGRSHFGKANRSDSQSSSRRVRERDRLQNKTSVTSHSPDVDELDEYKFVRITGMSHNLTEVDVHDFLKPVLTRNIYLSRHEQGQYKGKTNGEAIAELFSESDTRAALQMNGQRFRGTKPKISPISLEQIHKGIERSRITEDQSQETSENPSVKKQNIVSEALSTANLIPALDSTTLSNPQVQQLLTMLAATVSNLTTPAPSNERHETATNSIQPAFDDSVVERVASSANVDIDAIKSGRVVGIRNLDSTKSENGIFNFFRHFHPVPGSVRIHYLEDGSASGDGIISFENSHDAKQAISSLNKTYFGSKRVNLFFL